MAEGPATVTGLLHAWRQGDPAAFDRLVPLVYDELRRRARHYLRAERPNHTLQPTALVHEVYARLIGTSRVDWQNRAHFFALAARQMRQILVDSARARRYQKRGGGAVHVAFDEAIVATERGSDLEALDDAIDALAKKDERKARIVELRYFGGLTNEEIAVALGISTDTVMRDWQMAKLWLRRSIRRTEHVDH